MEIRTMVTGSRTITNTNAINEIIRTCPWTIGTLLQGDAYGADRLFKQVVLTNYPSIKVIDKPAKWYIVQNNGSRVLNKKAGYDRNLDMVNDSQACLFAWDGLSGGTQHAILNSISSSKYIHGALVDNDSYKLLEPIVMENYLVLDNNTRLPLFWGHTDYPVLTRDYGPINQQILFRLLLIKDIKPYLTLLMNNLYIKALISICKENKIELYNSYNDYIKITELIIKTIYYQHYDRILYSLESINKETTNYINYSPNNFFHGVTDNKLNTDHLNESVINNDYIGFNIAGKKWTDLIKQGLTRESVKSEINEFFNGTNIYLREVKHV